MYLAGRGEEALGAVHGSVGVDETGVVEGEGLACTVNTFFSYDLFL